MFARSTDAEPTGPEPCSATFPAIAGVGAALTPHRYDQLTLMEGLRDHWRADAGIARRLARLHKAVRVEGRNLAVPMEQYAEMQTFGDRNDTFIRVGTELGAEALSSACAAAGIAPADLDALFFTTVTGLATPTVDARLVNQLGLNRNIRRFPFFGLGCVGGAAGIARMNDYLQAWPSHAAALVSVELCSLTVQHGDDSVANLIASGLFGDGAAAVVSLGAQRSASGARRAARPAIVATRSTFYPDTERVMGWDISETGFKVVLSAGVPQVVAEHIGADVDAFLADHGLERGAIDRWICHPGGPKVIEAMERALGLDADALELTRRSLAEIGNLSSASVLHVLGQTLEQKPPTGEGWALLMAMGPGFCSELVLLRW